MVKKINPFVDLERKETGVTESAAEENKSDSGSIETDNKECISECRSIEVAGSTPEAEVTTVQSSISKDELTKVVENVFESKEIEAVESSLFKCEESTGKDLQVKVDESRSVTKKEVDSTISDDVAGFHIPEHPCAGNMPSTLMKSLDEFPEPPVLPVGQAEELPVTQVIDKAGSNTDVQEQDPVDITTTEQQGPVVGVSEIQVKKVDDTNGSQNTEYMNIALLKPPFTFRDEEEVPVAQVKETAKGCSDSERNECQDTAEGDEDGSSQETYCSESSFQRTECAAQRHVHIVLESESECHQLSEGTGSLGGASQATTVDIADAEGGASQASTVDVADAEAMPCSEADIFASQNEEDADVSAESSGTVPDYSDFVKGSHDRSKQLMQSSTALSMDGTQVPSSTPQTSCTKSARKHKHDELVLSHPPSKLRRFADDDKGEDFNVEWARYSKERSSLGVDILPSSPVHSPSNDDVTSCKTILQTVSPTRVTLKEKEEVFGQKANGQQQSFLASPKTNRKLIFETGTERLKTQLVPSSSGSKGNATEKVEFKTDQYREEGGQDDVSSLQDSIDYSPEIEIVSCIKSRQSTEVLYVSSHSCDSTKSSSQHGTSTGRRRSSEDTVYVTDTGSNAGTKKDAADTEAESSDEFFLHLSPSQSQKSVYLTPVYDNNDVFHSTSLKLDPKSHSSYTGSNADVLISESQSDKETLDAAEQNNKLAPGCFNSEKHSVCTVHVEEIQEGNEKPSQLKSSGSCTDTGHTNISGNVTRQKLSIKDAVSPGGSHCVTESFTAFSKVKDVFQSTAVEPSQCVAQVDSERQLRWSKRKRDDGNQDTQVDSSAISDNESDGQVQKKAKMETADITTGHEFTPSNLPQELLAFQQKGILGLHSTPQADHVTPAKQPSASSIEQDSVQETDTEWEVILKVKVKQLKQSDKDVYRVQQCEDITEDIARLTARILGDSSSSSGALADTSSKNTTPSSTASGGCPFPLPPNRLSLISTTSGSSTSSGGSSVVQGVMRQKCTTDGGPFLIPNNPGLKVSKERSFRSEEVLCGIQPGICSPIVEGCEIMHKVISSSHPERSERDQGRSSRNDKGDSGKKSDIQKPDDGSILHDDHVVIKTTDAVNSSPADSDAVLVPADVLKETPKSTVKVLKRRRSRSSVKKSSLPLSSSKQSVVRNRGQLSPIEDKTPITSSVEDVVTLIAESETKDGSDTATRSTLTNPEVSSLLLECSYLKLGTPVFARWTDKKYYSGRLQERCKDGRLKVLFDDTSVKLLVEDFVIAVDQLPMGQLVYALAESGDYESGVIVNVEKKCNDTMYIVELDDNSYVTVSRSSICMTEDQAKILREMVVTSPTKSLCRADISLDNVLLGKRNRSSSRDIENKLDCPGVSGMSKASPSKKVASTSLTESDTSSVMEDVDGVEPESHEIKLGKVKGLERRTPRKNLGNLLGPIPPAGSKLFAGKLFLLTSSDTKHLCTKREDAEGYDSECQCTACSVSQNAVFSRSHLTEQIKAGGGKLYDRFEDVPPSKYDTCYLISDRPNQTAKFILCLAHGIPLVSYAWIIECCETNVCQSLSKHYLAAGWSLEKRGYVRRDVSERPLFCVNIGLISDTQNSRKFWELVLKGAGAFVFGISQTQCMNKLEHLEVVVSSRSCPVDIQKELEKLGTPLVSTTWIVQCLINGSKVPTDNKTAL